MHGLWSLLRFPAAVVVSIVPWSEDDLALVIVVIILKVASALLDPPDLFLVENFAEFSTWLKVGVTRIDSRILSGTWFVKTDKTFEQLADEDVGEHKDDEPGPEYQLDRAINNVAEDRDVPEDVGERREGVGDASEDLEDDGCRELEGLPGDKGAGREEKTYHEDDEGEDRQPSTVAVDAIEGDGEGY